jgi:hypothetical protein
MATRNCITRPSPESHGNPSGEPQRKPHGPPHSHLLTAYLQVARTASERALSSADCPDVQHLLQLAHEHLENAHLLVETDRRFAAA